MLLVREKFNEQWDKWKFRGGEVKMKEDVLTKVLSMCSYKESNNALKCFRPVPFKPSHFHQPENIFFLFIRIMTVIFQMFIVSTEGIMALSNESSGTFTSWGHHIPILSPVEMQPYGRRHRSKDSVSQMDSMIRRIWAWKHKNLSIINTYFPSPLKKKKQSSLVTQNIEVNIKYISKNCAWLYQPSPPQFPFLGRLLILVPEG